MRVIIQRVTGASVTIDHVVRSSIGCGLMILIGIEDTDNDEDVQWLSSKIVHLRIFDDAQHMPNLSVKDIDADILIVSQFTLFASTKKGNRPGYSRASKAGVAVPLYERFVAQMEKDLGKPVFTGMFGADMKVALVNDGPVTIMIDTKDKE